MKNIKLTTVLMVLLGTSATANAFDSYSVELGRGNESTLYKVAAQKNWCDDCAFLNDHQLASYWEVSAEHITERKYDDIPNLSTSVNVIGWTPALRWYATPKMGWYVEAAIGANYFTKRYDNDGRIMGGQFQFGDHLGLGYKFSNSLDVTLKFQHYSNAGIHEPNPAVNYTTIKLAYSF